ncbi:MAG: hypothetical protein FJX29_03090 [Alphaproteobacteria bacterium]|nr:hypothetical protein [Alphaproteobacteria bacterium]
MKSRLLIALAVTFFAGSAFAQQHTIRIGAVRSVANAVTMTGADKGWYQKNGIEVIVEDLNASADAISLLATNRLQIVEGGLSAGYFNGLARGLPVMMVVDRTTSPLHHKLVVRADLRDKIKTIADLKGRSILSNAKASVTSYEVGKILETAGLKLSDIDLKLAAFPLMGAALKNQAADAALIIQPFASQVVADNIAFVLADPDDYAQPRPITIGVTLINTDWAKQNPEVARKFFVEYMRGVRDFCIAYHDGPNRTETIDRLIRMGPIKNRAFFEKFPWPGRSINGMPSTASIMDIQKYYVEIGVVKSGLPLERVFDSQYIDHANKVLGPLPATNPNSKKPGCN